MECRVQIQDGSAAKPFKHKHTQEITTWELFHSEAVAWPKTSEDTLEGSGAWGPLGEPQALLNTDGDGFLKSQNQTGRIKAQKCIFLPAVSSLRET